MFCYLFRYITIRDSLSANVSIILARTDSVLSIKEALVQYDDKTKKPFVEKAIGEQEFERTAIELGIRDVINMELKSGSKVQDKIKVGNTLIKEEENN